MGKPTAKLISAFVFATRIVQFLFFLNPKGHLCFRCKKSLNLRFGRTKFSCYDYGAEFIIYRRRNIYTFVYKTVWLIKQNPDSATKYFHNPPHLWQKWTIRLWYDLHLFVNSFFRANIYGLVCHVNAEQYPHINYLLFCNFKFILKEMLA